MALANFIINGISNFSPSKALIIVIIANTNTARLISVSIPDIIPKTIDNPNNGVNANATAIEPIIESTIATPK